MFGYLHKLEKWSWPKLNEDFVGKRHVQDDATHVAESDLLDEDLPEA
jgi:hypothetical protein